MNPDIKTTEKVAKLKDIKLSDSSRARIQNNLHEYAAFHSVRDGEAGRSIGVVPTGASLFSFKFATMPFVILLAVMIGGGTSLAAQGSVPGDILYPIKTSVNENIRGALAVSVDSEAKLQANLLEERLKEAQELQAKGRLTGDTATKVATNISAQTNRANAVADRSSEPVQVETKAKIALSIQNFLATTNLDATLAAEISPSVATTMATSIATSKMSSDLATGLYDINAYRADMKARTKALADVMQKNQAKIAAGTYLNLNVKVTEATKLTAEAETQAEADARATLDKAATLTGEVEATLSTLGQVEIDAETGMITDIDFSIDPMIIDRGDGSGEGVPTDPRAAQSGVGVAGDAQIDTAVSGSLDSNMIDGSTDSSASGGIDLGL